MKKFPLLLIIFLLVPLVSCGNGGCDFLESVGLKKKKTKRFVEFEQVDDIDGSTNDRYIFRKEIEKEKWEKNRYIKEEF